jgi:hypothetical protein
MTGKKIKIQENRPYLVQGDIPLVRKLQISSEYGEPMMWQNPAMRKLQKYTHYVAADIQRTNPIVMEPIVP